MPLNKTLKINTEYFKINGQKKKSNKTMKVKPILDKHRIKNLNNVKKEMLKKVKDYQKNKEIEKSKENSLQDKIIPNNFEMSYENLS